MRGAVLASHMRTTGLHSARERGGAFAGVRLGSGTRVRGFARPLVSSSLSWRSWSGHFLLFGGLGRVRVA